MKAVSILILIMALAGLPSVALAQAPTPDIPYNFEPIELEEGPAPVDLLALTTDTGNINEMGSYTVTVWSILDGFAGGGVLAYLTIFLLALVAIRWVSRYVYDKPIPGESINTSEASHVASEVVNRLRGNRRPRF